MKEAKKKHIILLREMDGPGAVEMIDAAMRKTSCSSVFAQ
jgi:hypothetical protein